MLKIRPHGNFMLTRPLGILAPRPQDDAVTALDRQHYRLLAAHLSFRSHRDQDPEGESTTGKGTTSSREANQSESGFSRWGLRRRPVAS